MRRLALTCGLILGMAARAAAAGEDGPVTFCVDPDWPPYEVIDAQGTHQGIAADLLRRVADRAALHLSLHPTRDWDESIAASQAGLCDVLSFLNQSPKRDQWLVFTDPVFIDRNVIVTREDHSFVDDLAGISGETLVLPKGTSIEERVRRDFPNLKVVTTDSEAEAFAMVSQKKADMTMRSMIVAVYTIKKDGWFNLKISGQVPGYENNLRIGVRKEKIALRDRLNLAVAQITPSERAEIANRHVAITVQTGIDYRLLAQVVAFFSVVLLTSLFWVSKLRRVNRQLFLLSRTDTLTRLANRASLNERMEREYDRFIRYRRPFSVILLDIDYFKAVNDQFGHLVGDEVLVKTAELLSHTARAPDVVGRWGGEEFMVLCLESGTDQAQALAERLCAAMRAQPFPTGKTQTISAGVATLADKDSIDDLVNRADKALYQAKTSGRDRVVTL
ncbi:MAG: diguanylate cyclase [Alphaproteobacteria bacterium]|nr:diguanylate cyclase [Alphaproteobacteria bacterium]